MSRHYELINASLVALVAIVGMVFYFNSGGGALGAFHENRGPWQGGQNERFYQIGLGQAGPACTSGLGSGNSGDEWGRCCQNQCIDICHSLGFDENPKKYWLSEEPFKECGKGCVNGCDVAIRTRYSIGFNYRGERTSPAE